MNYFKSLRRKIGVLLLGITCLFTIFWVRSFSIEDRMALTIGNLRHVISSCQGAIAWEHWIDDGHQGSIFGWSSGWRRDVSPIHSKPFFRSRPGTQLGNLKYESRSVPFWPFVPPLSALSAWLLLSKKPAKTA